MALVRMEVRTVKGHRELKQGFVSRRRWTEADARAALGAAAKSGLSLPAFAARHGLEVERLWRWRRVLGGGAEIPRFREIKAEVAVVGGTGFEIGLRNGRVVRVGSGFDAEALVRLLAVVDERPC